MPTLEIPDIDDLLEPIQAKIRNQELSPEDGVRKQADLINRFPSGFAFHCHGIIIKKK